MKDDAYTQFLREENKLLRLKVQLLAKEKQQLADQVDVLLHCPIKGTPTMRGSEVFGARPLTSSLTKTN